MAQEIIFFNGESLPAEQAKVLVSAPSFLYGWGVFETLRARRYTIPFLKAHLERLKSSARLVSLRLPYSGAKLEEILRRLIKMNGFTDTYLRLSLYQGQEKAEVVVLARRYQPYSATAYKKGFCAGVCRFTQDESSLLARIKSASRILYEVNLREVKEKGFDEGIMLNSSGHLAEGTRSNLFFVKDDTLLTPALECGCLPGIIRRAVLEWAQKSKIKSREGKFSLQDLYNADEAFLTNSLWGVMPLSRVEGIEISGRRRLADFFLAKFNRLIHGN